MMLLSERCRGAESGQGPELMDSGISELTEIERADPALVAVYHFLWSQASLRAWLLRSSVVQTEVSRCFIRAALVCNRLAFLEYRAGS